MTSNPTSPLSKSGDRSTLLPALAESIIKRRNGSSQNDGLELCKQAVALLVGDIRAEVQQAVAILKSEASISGGGLGRHGPMTTKLMHVAENLQHAEKEALGKLRDLLKSSNWELGQRLDQQMHVNAQLGDQMQTSWEQILEVVNRLEVQMQRLEGRMEKTEEGLTKDVSNVQASLKQVSSQIGKESQNMQSHETNQVLVLERKLVQQISDTQNYLHDQMKTSGAKVGKALQQIEDLAMDAEAKLTTVLDTQDALKSAASTIASDIHRLQRQDDKHYTDLGLSLETKMAEQNVQLSNFANTSGKFFEPVQQDIVKIRRKVNDDTRIVLGEISRIQKALQVDYVSVDSSRKGNKKAQDGGNHAAARSRTPSEVRLPGEPLLKPEVVASGDSEDEDMLGSKRCRDYSTQTDPLPVKESVMQTDPVQFENPGDKKPDKKKKKKGQTKEDEAKEKIKRAATFGGADKLKEQATAAAMKKQYNVFDYYKEEGWVQKLAKHPWFDNFTIFMVFVNSIWISVDADLNKEALILNADPVFIIAENVFCTYFFFEICVRFAAFQRKINAFKDRWFIFDAVLVSIMVIETWLTPGIMAALNVTDGVLEGTSTLRSIRLVRLLRLTRLTRLLRAFPELVIIMKGIAFAFRSVCIFFALWLIIIYIAAILFKQLTEGTPVGEKLFNSVPEGINTLLLHGVFGANAGIMKEITDNNAPLWPLTVLFMALVSLTIMYMLLGVLVDVIGAVASSEKQKLEIAYIVGQLRDELEMLGHREDMKLTQYEFQNVVLEPGVVRVMHESGVDVGVLADMLDLVWEDVAKGSGVMTFADLVNLVLDMRGKNPATVKDCKEQIRVTKSVIKHNFEELSEELNDKFKKLRQEIQNLDDDDEDE